MTEEQTDGGLYIDSDWKQEAAKEKERLAAEEAEQQAKEPAGPPGEPGFLDLVNMMAMQAIVALGGGQGPGGEQYPPNPPAAKHCIDLLGILVEKTEGNLSDEEQRVLEGVLYELRMQFVQAAGGGAPQTPPPAAPTGE